MAGHTPDVVIYDALVLTVDSDNRLLDGGTVVVTDGRITEVRPSRADDDRLDADHSIDGDGKLVLPGLVNTHTHLEMTPLVGAVSDWDLRELLLQMTVFFDRLDDEALAYFRQAGYELAALNFLRGGVTTVNAMDIRPGQGAKVFGSAGLRGFFGPAMTDLFWDVPVAEQFDRFRSFVEAHHDTYDGRIRATICPHDDWSCSREFWEQTADLAADYPDLLVHTHLLELAESNTMGRANGGDDSLDMLESVGLLDDRLVAAHCRVADDDDIRRFAAADAAVAHCPSVMAYWNPDPEMQWTPVPEMRAAGIDVGLGIDDHYWHDSYNMFGEARQARMAANLKRTAGQYESMELLRMLTIEGARALGVGDQIGSIEPGKQADLIVLDVDKPKFTPLTNVPAQVVNGATPADVVTVLVDGTVLLRDGTVETMEPDAVRDRVETAVERFQDETDWDLSLAGGEPPGTASTLRDIPKRGPARLLGRLAVQHVKDTVSW
ncbi:amidohydrolase family protein [Halomicroarcula sp. F28]|uniref:amidohydrolase family protein n=1 Tax=Haloarcula salinisoli TaxID=2487746 RepID=UPI001C738957|nr:amidohydrolase family protein [Halomicroarcula salinisoli]MBX0285835.1 amidohydrolase family protein [Halomicroarcula salinisoli]